ncbi:flagellar hook-associated protein FlgK [Salisediminibacterium beveridgei]|uniref:Flagellar hook-associated protein 1 n=1 Tax=Salisediminibacterium beveridgei TaxID=632773 RepID=A0A1D7QSA8_9BACI|nr:flagellar hook-associated protein FlgK [Salisediminibacterium beveridgei]AOM81900.1 Flagellar hook-associated protein FlgK [Salisediminibacterium beveridgei]
MLSTFHGLETARRGLNTTQTALHTTGHNIANANTPGYSRQRVNMNPTDPFPNPAFNKPGIPGQLGTGVKASEIQRVRDEFLDLQYRGENNQHGYWAARNDAWVKVEDIMNEPSESGLAKTMDQFWESLQDLSVNPEDSGARGVVRQNGVAVADTFNLSYDGLEQIQRDYGDDLEITADDINSLLRQLNSLNTQISKVEPHGMLPNDLYDERDVLVDELSKHLNIKVDTVGSGGVSNEVASGKYTITMLDDAGRSTGIKLIDGSQLDYNELDVQYQNEALDEEGKGLATGVTFLNERLTNVETSDQLGGDPNSIRADAFPASGEFLAKMEAYGYVDGEGEARGIFPEMLKELDTMVHNFAAEFNDVHRSGWSLAEIDAGEKMNFDFFDFKQAPGENGERAAKFLKVHDEIMESRDNIAASGAGDLIAGGMALDEEAGPAYPGEAQLSVNGRFTGDYDAVTVTYDDGNWTFSHGGEETVVTNAEAEEDNYQVEIDGLSYDVASFFNEDGEIDGDLADNTTFTMDNLQRDQAFSGDGSNALALANVKDTELDFNGNRTDIQSYYQAVIGEMAVQTSESERLTKNTDVLRDSVNERRQSVSSVSLDEEMTMMIQFQHAYNAAARSLTAVDEMLDRIINQMGLVGR